MTQGYGIAVDGAGSAYVTGYTSSSDFPTTPGAFDTSYNGGYGDAFVVKLNPAGSALAYATFLGGSGRRLWPRHRRGRRGQRLRDGLAPPPATSRPRRAPSTPSYNGGDDAFVVKLNPAGSALAYATFLGGSGDDYGYGIAVDGAGSAYVTG